MNLLADEGVDAPIIHRLRQEGHVVVVAVAELSPGITDRQVLKQANAQGALRITADKGFGELVFRQRRVHTGVVLLRLAGLPNAMKAEIVAEVCRERTSELVGKLTVISPGRVRIRPPS